ncbi:MAG: hypothetical protein WBG33_16745, partial [Rhodanobacter sp.]
LRLTQEADDLLFGKALLHVQSPSDGGLDSKPMCYSKAGGRRLHDKFAGEDKLICKSLLSWVNAGSHFVDDPLFVSHGDVAHETFLRIFKEIFVKMRHEGHYRMMMRSDVADPVEGQMM